MYCRYSYSSAFDSLQKNVGLGLWYCNAVLRTITAVVMVIVMVLVMAAAVVVVVMVVVVMVMMITMKQVVPMSRRSNDT